MDLAEFERSLEQAVAPGGLTPALVGLWHALRGEWDLAHEAVQPLDAACSWVHAVLHREEGDLSNARYWYRRAGRPQGSGDPHEEYRAVVAALLAEDA